MEVKIKNKSIITIQSYTNQKLSVVLTEELDGSYLVCLSSLNNIIRSETYSDKKQAVAVCESLISKVQVLLDKDWNMCVFSNEITAGVINTSHIGR